MSLSQPLAAGKRCRDEGPLVGSCTARVLILIDIAELPAAAAAEKRANRDASGRTAWAAAGVVDGVRLSVLRVLTQLCLSCPVDSWVEWAPRFFDSRPGGVGKTPSELRARLRSRQVPLGVRGFRKVTQASFATFGETCLAMVCGNQGDPLARDRENALRRWAHGQKKQPPIRTQPRPSEPRTASGPGPAGAEDSREHVSKRMYAGHDMSSHEVVVRSLLEVLQEFEDAREGDRTAAPVARGTNTNSNARNDRKLQLLLLHSAFPRTDEDAEQFALGGNFTTEAATVNNLEPPERRAAALDDLFSAHLGKTIARARSRGVSFFWQEGGAHNSTDNNVSDSDTGGGRHETRAGGNHGGSCLQRCLSAAGGSGVLHWGRVVGSTGLLPPSAALGRQFGRGQGLGQGQPSDRQRAPGLELELELGQNESDVIIDDCRSRKGGEVVGVALNRRGDVDVHLVASVVSGIADAGSTASEPPSASGNLSQGAALLPVAVGTCAGTTPWRLMGTVPIGEVWPSCLTGQSWGATRILCADGHGHGDGCAGVQLWREFLGELVAEEMVGVMTLPQRLFGCSTPLSSDGDARQAARLPEALAVALVVPISHECAVCFNTERLAATLPGEQQVFNPSACPRATPVGGVSSVSSADERGQCATGDASAPASGGLHVPPAGHSCEGPMRAELALKLRGVEVGLAMQESSLARKRRRLAKTVTVTVPGKGARGMRLSNSGSSIAGVQDRGVLGGSGSGLGSGEGHTGSLSLSLSQRDSGSLCFTGEGECTSGDGNGAACDVRQWRLEMEMASVTSNGSVKSASPRGHRLFSSTPGLAIAEQDDDDQMSSTGSSSLSGPKRALYQALEDVSSRSSLSLLGPDADSVSTPGSKEGGGWSAGASAAHPVDGDVTASTCRSQRGFVFPAVDKTAEAETETETGLSDVLEVDIGASVLPLSLMSEPALACLPGPALPVELVALADRCSRSNQTVAAEAAAAALDSKAEETSGEPEQEQDFVAAKPQTACPPHAGARQRFVDAVRSSERRRQEADAATPMHTAGDDGTAEEAVSAPDGGEIRLPEAPVPQGGEEEVKGAEEAGSAEGDAVGTAERGACVFDEAVSRGVAGLQMQYREVVERGQRSPVDFVVCAVPKAVLDMVDGGKYATASVGHDRDARAAQVLAAVVGGLTSAPKELSSKHRANRSAGASAAAAAAAAGAGAGAAESGSGASSTAAAKPAVQKIRDYQLQALLLCQLNSLAMDLPESPESLNAFSSLAASETGDASGDAIGGVKSKKGKDKRKRRRRKEKESAPKRPSDPLPACRRARLVDYLQPISTMLDACTVTKPPPVNDDGGGASADGDKAKGSQSRAYDGTLADFMGLALVEHFAERLPRTLGALFEDFERHPPPALTAALTGTPSSAGRLATGGAVAAGNEAGGGASKDETDTVLGGANHALVAEEPFATVSAPKKDLAGSLSSSRGSTAGILLSDRTPMSHNHFKMSGVLNGYREIKLKGRAASGGGLRPSVLGKVSGNGQGGRDAQGSAGTGEGEGWRTSHGESKGKNNGNGKSRRGARSRATIDPKSASAPASPSGEPGTGQQSASFMPPRAAGVRHSPRLNRRKQPGGDGVEDGGIAGTKRKTAASGSPSSLSATATPGRKRRLAAAAPGGDGGVLVGETPQKRQRGGSIGGVGAGARSSGRRGGGAPWTSVDHGDGEDGDRIAHASPAVAGKADADAWPTSPAAAGPASRKSSKRRVPVEARIAGSPSFPMTSPSAGPKKRRRALASGPASPAESLFVAESPGVSTGSVRRSGRSGSGSGWAAGTNGDGVSRQIMAESASPVGLGRRRGGGGAVVPDTPT